MDLDAADEDCGVRLEPVCGCKGVTYTSRACAYADGVRVALGGNANQAEEARARHVWRPHDPRARRRSHVIWVTDPSKMATWWGS
jgi:hypothetical protein